MTQLIPCLACQYGDHDSHTPVIRAGTPGLIGSRDECPCKGECMNSTNPYEDKRAKKQFESIIELARKTLTPQDHTADEATLHRLAETDAEVDHPAHYGGDTTYEVIKVLEAWGLMDNAYLFNAVKYVARSDKKGTQLQDLKKARWYLDRAINQIQGEDTGPTYEYSLMDSYNQGHAALKARLENASKDGWRLVAVSGSILYLEREIP